MAVKNWNLMLHREAKNGISRVKKNPQPQICSQAFQGRKARIQHHVDVLFPVLEFSLDTEDAEGRVRVTWRN